jgi:uncharacterized caspase-like protein
VQTKLIVRIGTAAFFAIVGLSAHSQQPDATPFNSAYKGATAKAAEECRKFWANPVFDPLRDKVPLGSWKPTMQMLTSSARLDAKDRPLARQAITVVQQCRMAYAPAYAMLPEPAQTLIEGLYREEDALIAELYTGKITFGEFNVGSDRLAGEIFRAFSGMQQSDAAKPTGPAHLDASPPVTLPRDIRLALVIGNSKYTNLPKLANPTNDAEAIAETLGKMGYGTRLLLNASEQDLRREARKFAADSNKADVALVFYAGHGAQLNGENYLLPADIDIPQTEADIQLSGLKVDDLINSIRSHTKIVFLDACRDNPALFKNLAKGRGSRAAGLAPTVGSNLDPGKPGGGIFIAYATDSGSIAADGAGKHSPFTQALLRYLQQPMSIDDMFSLVTKEVRLVTNNAQRPYKYASLEAIICVAGPCSGSQAATLGQIDIAQQAKNSEAEELQIALRTNSIEALKAYLEKYPETSKRSELLSTISRMRRAEFTEWTMYRLNSHHFPQFMRLSSIRPMNGKAVVELRYLIDPSDPSQKYPKMSHGEDLVVFDCNKPIFFAVESRIIDPSGEVLHSYKWGDPASLDLSTGSSFTSTSIASVTQRIVCDEGMRTPLVDKGDLAKMKFLPLSSAIDGDGDMFYSLIHNENTADNQREAIVVDRLHNDRAVDDIAGDLFTYRTRISRIRVNCVDGTMVRTKSENYDVSNNLVYLRADTLDLKDITNAPVWALLRRIVCNANEAAK